MLSPNFVIIGAILNLIGSASYAAKVIKGKVQPNRVSWFMWSLAPLIAFAAEIGQSVGLQSLMTFMVGFGPFIVFAASFVNKKSVWKLTSFDFICGILSLTGLALWLITRHGDTAILFSILADGLAAVPTILKSYKRPETEHYLAFGLSGLSAGITLLTIKTWNFANDGFPIYILIICAVIFALIRFKLGKKISAYIGSKPGLPNR